jgi:hypothetical protein
MSLHELYEQHIQPLPSDEQLRLVERIVAGIVRHENGEEKTKSIMQLHGNGADCWRGVDAKAYVDELRGEWDRRP